MALEVWLNFTDEKGEPKRVLVEGERFSIGRTPDNDLQIPLGNLSRQHVKIERFADVLIISDCGSSNGSFLNGEKIENPVALKDGDKLNLGGGVDIEIEFVSDKPKSAPPPSDDDDDEEEEESAILAAGASTGGGADSGGSSSISTFFLVLVPILGIFVLLMIGVVFLLINNNSEPEVAVKENKGGFVSSRNTDEDPDPPTNKKTPEKTDTPPSNSTQTTPTPGGGTATPTTTEEPLVTPKTSSENDKIDANSSMCLRRIAQNDPRAFLTTKQISILSGKISQVKSSGALAENLRNAKKNDSQIESLANSKKLKPLFLTVAALTKLGNQKGDVLTTAQGMADTLQNLSIQISGEFANESLLVIAAYDQGVAGRNLEMRDLLAKECLPEKHPGVSCREIRSIWFLKDNGKIDESQFEFALRFLAIGTIAQNPKDFGVQADAVSF